MTFGMMMLTSACAAGRGTPDSAAASNTSDSTSTAAANAGLDTLNAHVAHAYATYDSRAYGALYTDNGQFEWSATPTVRGHDGLEKMAAELWPPLKELGLVLNVASRQISQDHATEFGAFQESWRDSTGGRTTEYGRYVTLNTRQPDKTWRIEHFFGFEDSTRHAPPAVKHP